MMVPLSLLAGFAVFKSCWQWSLIILSNDDDKDALLLEKLSEIESEGWERIDDWEEIVDPTIEKRPKAAFPQMCKKALEEIRRDQAHGNNEDKRKEAIEEVVFDEGILQLDRLKRGLKSLHTVVTVAPLLGLLGTVYGMIRSFEALSLSGGGDKVKFLSVGIYEALVTTAVGLTIAIPCLFVYLWLSRKADEVGENLNRQARGFLGELFSGRRGLLKED